MGSKGQCLPTSYTNRATIARTQFSVPNSGHLTDDRALQGYLVNQNQPNRDNSLQK